MVEMYWCEKCGRHHKFDSKVGVEHRKLLPVETTVTGQDYEEITVQLDPEPEEVTSEGNLEEGFDSLVESSPAPETQMLPFEAHVLKQIQVLSDNDQKLSAQLGELQSNQYQAIQSTEAAGPWDGFDFADTWSRLPTKLQDSLTDILSGIGRLISGREVEDEDEKVVRAAVAISREKASERIALRAAQIAEAMEDPDIQLHTSRKEEIEGEP